MQALVIVAHGSHLNPDSSAPTYDHAETIRATDAFDEVRAGFWKEEPHLREVLRTVDGDELFVVPFFVSEGYFTEQVIPRELRLEGWDDTGWGSDGLSADHVTLRAADVGKPVHYCGPVGTHESMTDVIIRRAESVTGDPDVGVVSESDGSGTRRTRFQEGVGLAVVGHGTERNENSAKAIRYHADRVRDTGRFDEVRALFMDEQPEVDGVTDHFESPDVVVVPLFIADGFHTQEDIPEDMGLTDGSRNGGAVSTSRTGVRDHRKSYDVPATVDGTRIWYAGAVGTEPLMAEVILERAADAGADVGRAREAVRERTRVGSARSAAGTNARSNADD